MHRGMTPPQTDRVLKIIINMLIFYYTIDKSCDIIYLFNINNIFSHSSLLQSCFSEIPFSDFFMTDP